MESIKELFITGPGPSSSHTIGPSKAAKDFIIGLPKDSKIVVTLFGSLALTGKGHLTDKIIKDILINFDSEILFDFTTKDLKHPNTLTFKAYQNGNIIKDKTYYSIGGGKIVTDLNHIDGEIIYDLNTFEEIKEYCSRNKMSLVDYVNQKENKGIDSYLENVLDTMFKEVDSNINKEGLIPGSLRLSRVAKTIFNEAQKLSDDEKKVIDRKSVV